MTTTSTFSTGGELDKGPHLKDCTGVIISSYSNTQVTFTFGSGYGTGAGQYGAFPQATASR